MFFRYLKYRKTFHESLEMLLIRTNVDVPAFMLFTVSVSEILVHMQKYHYSFLFSMLLYNYSLAKELELFSLAFKLLLIYAQFGFI